MATAHNTRGKELERTVVLLDFLAIVSGFMFAFHVRNTLFVDEPALDFINHALLIPLLLALQSFFLSYFDAYQSPRRATLVSLTWSVFRAVAATIGVLLILLFFLQIDYISRLVVVVFAAAALIMLALIRLGAMAYYKHAMREDGDPWRVLIIGTGERAKEMARALRQQADWGVKIACFLDPDSSRVGGEVDGVPILGTLNSVSVFLKNNVIDEVIIAIPRSMLDDLHPIVDACEEEGIKLQFMADLFDVEGARFSLSHAGSIPLLSIEPVALDEDKLVIKRLFDITLTLLAMPIVLPIMAVASVAIKLDSPGPILFIQERVGLRKHLFPMLKFRSMHKDAEACLSEIEHLNEAEGPIFKIRNDPRLTRVGRVLRKTSLDELPQLFNVLRGEMSLVGPRPMSIRDVEQFDRGIQRKRFSVKPGITCLWQISGRSDLPFEKWLELDLEYIKNWSLWLDIKILVKTMPAVLLGKGAA
jgi:exopolysaccharide biosynthesis polyprenyl glycosylphosphotransferase